MGELAVRGADLGSRANPGDAEARARGSQGFLPAGEVGPGAASLSNRRGDSLPTVERLDMLDGIDEHDADACDEAWVRVMGSRLAGVALAARVGWA